MIDAVELYCQSESSCIVAYFYFDFNDPQKQQASSLLRSLLTQLSTQSPRCPDVLVNLHSECQKRRRQATSADFLNAIKDILENYDHAYIFLDALDECSDRDRLLWLLKQLSDWQLSSLHLAATSRTERWIEDGVAHLVSVQIGLDSHLVDADIHIYLNSLLAVDPRFKKWSVEERGEIESTLMRDAHGM